MWAREHYADIATTRTLGTFENRPNLMFGTKGAPNGALCWICTETKLKVSGKHARQAGALVSALNTMHSGTKGWDFDTYAWTSATVTTTSQATPYRI